MSQSGDDPSATDGGLRKNLSFSFDAAFQATPISANVTEGDTQSTKIDTTFIQNQITSQRSPSTTQLHVSALSRHLSQKSTGSHEIAHRSANDGALAANEECETRRHGLVDSNSSLLETTTNCSLKKSASAKSTGSVRSVRSVHAVGSFPLGSLQVHRTSPVRENAITPHQCLKSGDVVIVRDVPAGTIFGCDTMAFTIKSTGDFDGIKDIPYGAHFIWAASSDVSTRNGFWIMTKKIGTDQFGEIHVKHWNTYNESLEEEISAAEKRIQQEALPEILSSLKPYCVANSDNFMSKAQGVAPGSQLYTKSTDIWYHLTSCMKGSVLDQITGFTWNEWPVSSTHDCKRVLVETYRPEDTMESRKDEVLDFAFSRDQRAYLANTFGRERTEQFLDTSVHINTIISRFCLYEDSDQVIGEMQFCYIVGMTLGNLTCQEHWAHIVKILFCAHRLALDNPLFFQKAIEAVHAELIYDDSAFEASIFDQDPKLEGDLKLILTTFKSRLNEQLLAQGSNLTDAQNEVGKAFEELESWLWKWGWDLRGSHARAGRVQLENGEIIDVGMEFEAEDERGEYAPMVVDGDGRELGILRMTT